MLQALGFDAVKVVFGKSVAAPADGLCEEKNECVFEGADGVVVAVVEALVDVVERLDVFGEQEGERLSWVRWLSGLFVLGRVNDPREFAIPPVGTAR